jgi:hypothetical protein
VCDSTGDPGFWWNWGVNAAVAVGTFLAVAVALFGDILRSRWYPPILQLRIPRRHGELTTINYPIISHETGPLISSETGRIVTATEAGRFYHLEVSNTRRLSPAVNTQVMLTSVTLPGPGGMFQEQWHGEVPMRWQHYEVYSHSRTVGHPVRCDICSVTQGGKLELHTAFVPNNLKQFLTWNGSVNLICTFVAISDRADSEVLKVRISWDGRWEESETEMAKHLIVRVDTET